MKLHLLRFLGLMFLLLAAGHAQALCVGLPVKHVFVGDTASDPSCTFNDLQSAIDDAIPNPSCTSVIHITREHTYTDQHLMISNRNVKLVAWGDGVKCSDVAAQCTFSGCPLPAATSNPLVTIVGHDGDSVIHIDGASNVSLLNLTITGASLSSDQSGGGVYYDGTGSLSLTSTTVNLNHAGYGAGISMTGDGGPASLYLNEYSQILVNTADVSGGGIRLDGNARMYALRPHTLIGFNHAPNGYGGGVEVIGPARADIGSPGYNGLGVIYDNDAQYGGGIAALAISDQNDVTVRLFTTDPDNAIQVANNAASVKGGGIYLKSFSQAIPSGIAIAWACAFDYRINDNLAPDGTAIYADRDQDFTGIYTGSIVELNQSDPCGPELPSDLGAVECADGVVCNEMARNIAEQSDATPSDGATILVDNTGELHANKLVMRNNAGGRAIRLIGETNPDLLSQAGGSISNCLLVDNQLSAELIRDEALHYDAFALDACTFANNRIGASTVMHSEDALSVTNTLIDQPGELALEYTGVEQFLSAHYLLSNDLSTLPSDLTIQLLPGDPQFVDAAGGDYHLQPTSPAVDFAGGVGGFDLEGHRRDVDLPGTPNVFGPRDLGPYERQLPCAHADTLFCDGFEPAN